MTPLAEDQADELRNLYAQGVRAAYQYGKGKAGLQSTAKKFDAMEAAEKAFLKRLRFYSEPN